VSATFYSGKYFPEKEETVHTDQLTRQKPAEKQVEGLPVWYFVLAGSLVASFDIGQHFSTSHPTFAAALPLVLVTAHVTLWFTVLSRRREFIRSVWRSKQARLLTVGLLVIRIGLQLALTRVIDGAAPAHDYKHLIMGLTLLVLFTVGAWFDQWLILRTLNKSSDRRSAGK
jgi:hypothetical protein